jgi:hypothetical protein
MHACVHHHLLIIMLHCMAAARHFLSTLETFH